ncbi:hypothetical protein, partial [Sphingobium sp. Leaf26]|uniref:hypothetical protein n=1 Tax=Sphingobium sp. Leaf26 TaxID=1735693 RepID=UPI001F3F26F7
YSIRQDRRQLPWLHQARQHHAMAQMIKSSLQPSNLLILVDFTILTFADPSQPPGDANVKINPLEVGIRLVQHIALA